MKVTSINRSCEDVREVIVTDGDKTYSISVYRDGTLRSCYSLYYRRQSYGLDRLCTRLLPFTSGVGLRVANLVRSIPRDSLFPAT